MLKSGDLEKLTLLGTPAVHPVRKERVVLAKAMLSLEENTYVSQLVLMDTQTGTEAPLLPMAEHTASEQDVSRNAAGKQDGPGHSAGQQNEAGHGAGAFLPQDHSPKWSPNGDRLAFLRKVKGKDELWLYDLADGKLRDLTPGRKIKGFAFSPDGSKIVFTSRVNEVNPIAYKIKRARYKFDGEGMTNGYTQLFLIDLLEGTTVQLTSRDSDHGNPVFSEDGGNLYYIAEFLDGDDLNKQPRLFERDLRTGVDRSIRPDVKSVTALFRLDERVLVGIGKREIAESTEYDKWFQIDALTSDTAWLNGLPDVHMGTHLISDSKRPGSIRTAAKSGERFVYVATEEGKQSLFVMRRDLRDANGSTETSAVKLPIPMNVVSFDVEKCDEQECSVVFVGDAMDQPGELYRAVWRYGEEIEIHQLTRYHDEWKALLPPVDIQEYRYEAKDGLSVHGWSMSPVTAQASAAEHRDRYDHHVKDWTLNAEASGHDGSSRVGYTAEPSADGRNGTLLWIHGGPHLAQGIAFHYDFWYWVSLGYRVIFCNPRGSAGYGQAFARAIHGHWGQEDVSDVLGFLDMVLEQEGCADGEPLHVLGASYGGYLVNWIVAHDHRFRSAVTERSICNLYSKIGNSDNGFYNNPHQLGGGKDIWTDEELIMERSPIRYADQVNTPVFIIHGEQDQRCPIEQAEQWFIALKRLRKEVEFMRLPGAAHAYATAGRPKQRVARLEEIAAWLAKHG